MAEHSAKLLLIVFVFSVSIIPLLELGHEMLHEFKNPFHHHAIGHRAYSYHNSGDHFGFGKMKFAYQMEESQSMSNLTWFAYTFCLKVRCLELTANVSDLTHNTEVIARPYAVLLAPVTPPPLTFGI